MSDETEDSLRRRIAQLERINAALIERAERAPNSVMAPYDLFRANINLERIVRQRTEELKETLTEIKAINEELAAARDEAESANQAKSRFLAHVGHDLLQPLNAARLTLEMLSERHQWGEDKALIMCIKRAMASMEELLQALLDISRLASGSVVAVPRPVDVGGLFAVLMSEFGHVATRRGLDLTFVASTAIVRSDPVMLTRILQNFVSNALRYTVSGRVLVGARRRKDMLRIDVIDTGPGIPEHQHMAIFKEFHRSDEPLPDGEVGYGLGLSIVKRLAKTLGHHISLASDLGHGSRFSIEVPIETENPGITSSSTAATSIPVATSGSIVVVVARETVFRNALAELLARWRYVPVQVTGWDDAEAISEQVGGPPSLLLIDHQLLGEGGLEVAARFRSAFGRDIPVVVMSSDVSAAVTGSVAAAGFEFIRKPLRHAELRSILRSLLS